MNAIVYDEDADCHSDAHVWDDSGAAALEKIVAKCKEYGIEAELKGLNQKSRDLMKQMA